MTYTLAVDPGLYSPGAAILVRGVVVDTFNGDGCTNKKLNYAKRSITTAREIVFWCCNQKHTPTSATFHIVMEWPKIRSETQGKSVGDPNLLVPLAAVGTSVATMLMMAQRLSDVTAPMPHEWIGSIPKKCQACKEAPGKKSCPVCKGSAWKTPRGRMIKAALSEGERAIVPDQNDVIDAVGIGLWHHGRLRPSLPGLEL